MAMRCLVLASMLMVVGVVVLANLSGISAQIDCGGDLPSVLSKCIPFVKKEGPKIQPSQECCDTLKNVDFSCLCKKYITAPPFESQISLEKALYVARSCGRSVPIGFKCGNYTVPPPESAPKPSPLPEK